MKLAIMILMPFFGSFALALEANQWQCQSPAGVFDSSVTKVRIEKATGGLYSVYLTAQSGDVGQPWDLNDERIAIGLSCKFSKISFALNCGGSNGSEWSALRAEKVQIQYVDRETGEGKTTESIEITLSGSNQNLKNFPQSVLKFDSWNCSKN